LEKKIITSERDWSRHGRVSSNQNLKILPRKIMAALNIGHRKNINPQLQTDVKT
jgi:hypothetical protein